MAKSKSKPKPTPPASCKSDCEHLAAFKSQGSDYAKDVDLNQEHIWEGLAVAFFLGRGVSLDEARRLTKLAVAEGLA